MNYKDISEIRDDFNAGKYSPPEDMWVEKKHYKEDHVFDENLSVKRNREMVVEFNAENDRKRKEYHDLSNKLFNQLRDDVIQYIMGAYGMSKGQAEKIESYVYAERHSYMSDYFIYIDEIAGIIEDVMNIK